MKFETKFEIGDEKFTVDSNGDIIKVKIIDFVFCRLTANKPGEFEIYYLCQNNNFRGTIDESKLFDSLNQIHECIFRIIKSRNSISNIKDGIFREDY